MVTAIKLEMIRGPEQHGPDYDFYAASHIFQNMLEDVYRKLHGICLVDLEEMDRASHQFVVREIRRKDIGTVTTLIKRVLRHNRMLDSVRIVRVDRSESPEHPDAAAEGE